MTKLELYYNKFNEEKRFDSRHGLTEFLVSLHFINYYLDILKTNNNLSNEEISILDIGAGTGRYSIKLADEGYDVSAIELVKHNVARLKQKSEKVHARQGNALNLSKYNNEQFDMCLLFGPMYHLFGDDLKVKALKEAIRVTKKGGFILVAYCMNDYALISYGFRGHHIIEAFSDNKITDDFKVNNNEDDLYDYMRLSDIDRINHMSGIDRVKIVSPDGPANYIRDSLKSMSDEEFDLFIKYQICNADRYDLLGAGAHIVDILQKN